MLVTYGVCVIVKEKLWIISIFSTPDIPIYGLFWQIKNEGKLSFPDVLVSTTEENVAISVFCKTTAIGFYTNF